MTFRVLWASLPTLFLSWDLALYGRAWVEEEDEFSYRVMTRPLGYMARFDQPSLEPVIQNCIYYRF